MNSSESSMGNKSHIRYTAKVIDGLPKIFIKKALAAEKP
jgi:hypothetical protein